MKKVIFSAIFLLVTIGSWAQSIGDTIVVQALNYNSTSRDTMVEFPDDGSLTFEKIIMKYSMRCKDGLVSSGSNTNLGCGEWDYSCNTNITDSSRVDSVPATTNSHSISGFSGTTYNYVTQPVNNYYQNVQYSVVINSIISDTTSTVGSGSSMLNHVLHTDTHAGKSQYLFTQSELILAGASAGDIDGLSIDVVNNPENAKYLRVSLKETSKTVLDDTEPDLNGLTEVFYHNTMLNMGANRIQFHTPFSWNGTSNLIVELSFTNKVNGNGIEISGNSSGSGLVSYGDQVFNFNASNFIQSNGYKGIVGSQNRTVEAWIKTTVAGKEICGWGTNSVGQKWLLRLDGNGKLRTEVNSGYAVGTSVLNDGNWHHVAVVLNGDNTSDLDLYVDGVQETISSLGSRVINTGSSNFVRVGNAIHSLYWDGQIAEVRVWSSAVSLAEINKWKYRSVENTHANYSDLELYYPLNEGNGNLIMDNSGNSRNASVTNGPIWTQFYGEDHFKNLELLTERPNISFHQGQYNLTITNDTVVDTVAHVSNLVKEYQIFPKSGTLSNDSIGAISVNTFWEATSENVYDPNGGLVSSTPVTATGTINITKLNYYQRSASRFEIMSFVTPYGIGLDMGMEGESWTFDVTDYSPFLKGTKRIDLNRGGQWQEDMDITFLFIVGTPPRDVLDVRQIWKVNKINYDKILDDTYFAPRDVMMHPDGKSFKVRSMITGHGQEGEFISRTHSINVNGGSTEFAWPVWKTCDKNPVYPQGGTWVYDRAGWCPGMATQLQESDITQYVVPGQASEIDYDLNTASGSSSYIVNHQLVTYGDMNHAVDAAVVDIMAPSNKVEYGRYGSTCIDPMIKIQNTGSTALNRITVEYWVNGSTTPMEYTWMGNLVPMKIIEVTLPTDLKLWEPVSGVTNVFHARIKSLDNLVDEYAYNDHYSTEFNTPEVLPSEFVIWFKTNNRASENTYQIVDDAGNVVHQRGGMSNNTTYKDTITLPWGCYKFEVSDAGGDGLSWWANTAAGNGYIRLWEYSSGPNLIKTLEPDFGGEITYNFTIDSPLSYEEAKSNTQFLLYPNPAQNQFVIEGMDLGNAKIFIYDALGQEISLNYEYGMDKVTINTQGVAKGLYFVNIRYKDRIESKTVVIN